MSDAKLTLNLNEQNELAFKISIEGSSSDIQATKPKIRFLVSEAGGEAGWVYPTRRSDDGFVIVNIPNSEMFSEDKDYTGKLEVILGNHYFVPTEVDMEFIKPLKIEAAVVTANRSKINEATQSTSGNPVAVVTNTVQVRSKNKIEEAPKRRPSKPKRKKRQWEDLSEAEQRKVKRALMEKRKSKLRKAKLAEQKRKKAEAAKKAKAEEALKESLKNLMSNSLLDD